MKACTSVCSATQMLAFARQTFLLVSAAVMPFWVSLLQHSAPRATEAPRHSPLPDDAAAALLELAGASQGSAVLLAMTMPKIDCSSIQQQSFVQCPLLAVGNKYNLLHAC